MLKKFFLNFFFGETNLNMLTFFEKKKFVQWSDKKLAKKNKIGTQIHTQKINFFLILNLIFRNLQEICKTLKLKTQILKKFKTQTQTETFEYFWVHMSASRSAFTKCETGVTSKLLAFIRSEFL